MPRFDGTGPIGQGPMTGCGMGYCAMNLPAPRTNYFPKGFAGIVGTPINCVLPYYRSLMFKRILGRCFARFGRGRRMGRGRWFRM